jgi:NarL family two-component system response regulator LiaR
VIRILAVDDHDMLRSGLATILKAFPDLLLVGEASSGGEAIQQALKLKPDVILMDLLMPEMDGVSAIREIRQRQPAIRIIALSSFGEEELVRSALRAGATSYILKNVTADRLAEVIRMTHSGLPTLSPEVTAALLDSPDHSKHQALEQLTLRELEVLDLIAEGKTNDEISLQLSLSKNTVKNHVASILGKLGAGNRTEAARFATRRDKKSRQ